MNYFNIVKTCIDEWNPYDLLPEAPRDEFGEESMMISTKISDRMTAEQIAEIVAKVFGEMFDPENFTVENCMEVSNSIYNTIHSRT